MIFRVCVALTLFLSLSYSQASELLYLASGNSIEVKKIDLKTGKLSDFQKVEYKKLSKFTFSRNKQFLYAQAAMKDNPKQASIMTFKVATDGKLTFVHNAPIDMGTTELKTDHSDSFIAGANYGQGSVNIWKLEDGIYKGEMIQKIKLEKQAHATRFSPDNKMLMIPATGPNKIFQLSFDEKTGQVKQTTPAVGPSSGAAQPRHLIFHPMLNIAYSTLERKTPGVGTWQWNAGKGELTLIDNLQSSDDDTARITTADLHMSPDSKFLYISSRDKGKKLDAIIAYSIDQKSGKLTFVDSYPCENIPRSFCINKSGDFVYVAGQRANMMGVYKRDTETGALTKVTQYKTGNGPIWVETLSRD
ncbi:MAG: beta-propeller fold lactonase family protein [Lentisphaeraceae bacterium]|nr:beta-propeller fold lactonase family protein [Lentisphaeraceae bacterium]